ncbi:peroxide stress protein YaaA [Pontimonas sp.]|nr:peroxide stress protein YaaA [Pontimonas sp.]MDA8863245.1 peroxide stress protein YaaA [Pontimonas sp.]
MLVLLPPSETKVSGGEPGTSLDLSQLSFGAQNPVRSALLQQVVELSGDETAALTALKLGPKGAPEVQRNQEVLRSPVMPALERYTGVLFDALGVHDLEPEAQAWVEETLAVFSALFGLVRASDPIPAYRLSFDSKLSGGPLAAQWAEVTAELWEQVPDFVLDLRSEGYWKLAPVPPGQGVFVSLVKEGPAGSRKAVGHANKSVKGALVRSLAITGAKCDSVEDVVAWGLTHGYAFDRDSLREGVIDLVISDS